MLDTAAEAFLWRLFRSGLLERDSKQALEWAAARHDRDLELPERLQTLLTQYGSSGDRTSLLSMALAALENFWLDVDHRTRLTASLFVDGRIDLAQACAFLSFDGVDAEGLKPSVRAVADVLWLVKQDLDAQVMQSGDDNLMSEALHNLAKDSATG
jgi:hypothetical protein